MEYTVCSKRVILHSRNSVVASRPIGRRAVWSARFSSCSLKKNGGAKYVGIVKAAAAAAAPEMSDFEHLQHTFNQEPDGELYVPVGRATCYVMGEGKLTEKLVIEPIPAAGFEAMSKGMATSYTHVFGMKLVEALAKDSNSLPEEFRDATYAHTFDLRCKSAARTWDRPHAKENLMTLVPIGELRDDFNHRTDGDNKRILDMVHEVKDSDNIKQDMSIDVYGRSEEDNKSNDEIESLYNV